MHFLISLEVPPCLLLNQMYTALAPGMQPACREEAGPVVIQPSMNYWECRGRHLPYLEASLLCRECICLDHGRLRAALLAHEIKRGGRKKQPPIQLC